MSDRSSITSRRPVSSFRLHGAVRRRQASTDRGRGAFHAFSIASTASRTSRARYRRCYRGLLSSYFVYDGEGAGTPSAGRDNWRFLRTYLRERIDSIRAPGVEPEWVPAIHEHHNLLSELPYERYGRQLPEGDDLLFEEVKRRLDVPGASWLVRSIVIAQVSAATECGDGEFRGFLSALFALLSKHPLLLNDALAQILTRYSRCQPPDEHPGLRDFAVESSGNPLLPRNAAKWGLVDESCRQMAWLKRDLMQLFFEVLSQDGRNDKRRFEFWADGKIFTPRSVGKIQVIMLL